MSYSLYADKSTKIILETCNISFDKDVERSVDIIFHALKNKKSLLVCGNGGSASDAMHIAGEMVGRFLKERPAQKCIALSSNPSILTAWANDYEYETVFSRQVEAYGEAGGVLWALSTSGSSKNIINAIITAKKMQMVAIGMTGKSGGDMAQICDVLLKVPCSETPLIQQAHICIYHYICQKVEEAIVKI